MSNLTSMLKGFADRAFAFNSAKADVIRQLVDIGQVTPEVRTEFCVGHMAAYVSRRTGDTKMTKAQCMREARRILAAKVKERTEDEVRAYGAAREAFSQVVKAAGLAKPADPAKAEKAKAKREKKRREEIAKEASKLLNASKATPRAAKPEEALAIFLKTTDAFMKANAKVLTGEKWSAIRDHIAEIKKIAK